MGVQGFDYNYMDTIGLHPYRKDLRRTDRGIGDPRINHFPIKLVTIYRYMITNKKQWMLTKIKYEI